MASKKGASTGSEKAGNFSYVVCDLSEEQSRAMRGWAEQVPLDLLLSSAELLVTQGHTITLKRFTDGFQCTITGTSEDHEHYKQFLIARASSSLASLKVAIYKHFDVLDEKWPFAARSMLEL